MKDVQAGHATPTWLLFHAFSIIVSLLTPRLHLCNQGVVPAHHGHGS